MKQYTPYKLNRVYLYNLGEGMKKLVVVIILILFISCSHEKPNILNIEYKPIASLELVSVLEYINSDSIFIGKIKSIEIFNDNIYISDKASFQIHKFDLNLKS